jgi:acetyl-CoA carboxylase biotin carboxyl carrier protein
VDAIDLQQGDQRIRLRRAAGRPAVAAVVADAAPPPVAAPPAAPAKAAAAAPAASTKAHHEIKSELVGTFYAAPEPGAEPYVRVGTRVKPGDVLCKVEAMKIFNDVQADVAGVIVEVCVANQEAVEFGQVLFRLDPTA